METLQSSLPGMNARMPMNACQPLLRTWLTNSQHKVYTIRTGKPQSLVLFYYFMPLTH